VPTLNPLNITTDLSWCTGRHFADRGRVRVTCYSKLFAANLPWVFDLDTFRPRWTPQDLCVLRAVLSEAIHVVRESFPR
jgi:hypothetical protein